MMPWTSRRPAQRGQRDCRAGHQPHQQRQNPHARPGLTAQLKQSGRKIGTHGPSWKWSDQTRYRGVKTDWPNIYDVFDARAEDGDWTLPDYDDTDGRRRSRAKHLGRPDRHGAFRCCVKPWLNRSGKMTLDWPLTLNGGDKFCSSFRTWCWPTPRLKWRRRKAAFWNYRTRRKQPSLVAPENKPTFPRTRIRFLKAASG